MINKRFLTYLFIGVIVTLIDIILFSSLLYIFGNIPTNILFLNPISYSIAVICSFLLNGKFTFNDNNLTIRKFSKFYLSSTLGLIINTSIVFFLVSIFEINIVMSKIISASIIVIYNFTMCRLFIFRNKNGTF